MGKRSRRVYTREFKSQASRLAIDIGTNRASQQLGVSMEVLQKQKKDEVAKGQPWRKEITDHEAENKKLRAEIAEQKKVVTILKAAAAFVSQDHLK